MLLEINLGAASISSPTVPASRRRSVLLVFCCTLIGAAAQILMKIGMEQFRLSPVAILTNLPLIAGYGLYGLFTVGLVLALRDGELSMLYPIIALNYVWVTLLSYLLLKETPNLYKNAGILTIVIGVAVLGRGGRKS
jgi:drug/metabolite transporter (DMT)-like permease